MKFKISCLKKRNTISVEGAILKEQRAEHATRPNSSEQQSANKVLNSTEEPTGSNQEKMISIRSVESSPNAKQCRKIYI